MSSGPQFFNLAAILTLSTKPQCKPRPALVAHRHWLCLHGLTVFPCASLADLLAELPFILGAVLPIIFDAAMLFAIQSWHRRWERSKTRAARDEEKEANQELDLLDEERRCVVALMKLEELEQTVTAKRDKLKHLDDSTEAKEKHELNVELEHLQRDILVNQTALQKLENKIRERFDAAIVRRSKPRQVVGIVRNLAGEGGEREVHSCSASTSSVRSGSRRPLLPSNV